MSLKEARARALKARNDYQNIVANGCDQGAAVAAFDDWLQAQNEYSRLLDAAHDLDADE